MTLCIIHDALRESDTDSRCHSKDTAFLGDKPRDKAISRFFSSRHRDLINSVPCPGLNPSVLRLAVVLTAKQCRGMQTAQSTMLGSIYQVFLLSLIFFILYLR